MTSVKPVNSFEGKQKFSAYDLKQAEKIAVLSLAGDKTGAQEAFDEFAKDKKLDKARNVAISLGVLGTAILARRASAGKIAKKLAVAGDVIADWFKKEGETGKKVVSSFLDKDIKGNGKLKKTVKRVVDFCIKDPEYNASVKKFIKGIADKVADILKVNKVQDIAELGLAAGAATVVDNPINKFADRADEGKDMERQIVQEVQGEDF